VSTLPPETRQTIGLFLSETAALFGGRLRRAVARVSNPRAGSDPMSDVDVLLVVDNLANREMYRVWNIAGEACIKYDVMFSVQAYSTEDFEDRKNLPAIRAFLAEGLEHEIQ